VRTVVALVAKQSLVEFFVKKHEEKLLHHVKVEAIQLLDNSELVRRLKRKKNLFSWCSEHYKQNTVKCTINTISV
jgi:hypothetical protein